MKNITKGLANLLPKVALSIATLSIASCDFSYELAEANSKEDTTPPTAFFGSRTGADDDWNKAYFLNESQSASTFYWEFGDGTTSTDREPEEHAYPVDTPTASTSYTVTLTATDNNGLTDTYVNSVTITDSGQILDDYELYYDLVNNVPGGGPVSIAAFSSYQEDKTTTLPENILDGDISTRWTAEDGVLLDGEYRSDGEWLLFDLGSSESIEVIELSTDGKSDSYGYEIYTSNSTKAFADLVDSDFTRLIPLAGDMQLAEKVATLQALELDAPVVCKYVKLVSYGRFNDAGDTRLSPWNNWGEINFWATKN